MGYALELSPPPELSMSRRQSVSSRSYGSSCYSNYSRVDIETNGEDLDRENTTLASTDSDDDSTNPPQLTGLGPEWLGNIIGKDRENPNTFQQAVIGLIILNTLGMALQADMPEKKTLWNVVDSVFLSLFTLELLMKLCYWRRRFFCDEDWKWNVFDFCIVSGGIVDQWIMGLLFSVVWGQASHHEHGSLSKLMMMMRTIRILRVLRAVRLLKQFPNLYGLVNGLLNSFPSVVWVAVLFFMLLLVSSIFVTNVVATSAHLFENRDEILSYYGSIATTMNTLFVYLTCDDWSTSSRMVNEVLPMMEIFWIFYMFLGAFTLLSLLTGLMADNMNKVREDSEDRKAKDDSGRNKAALMELIKQKIELEDDRISLHWFEQLPKVKPIRQELKKKLKMKLEQAEARELYKAMRATQAKRISIGSQVKYVGPENKLEHYGLKPGMEHFGKVIRDEDKIDFWVAFDNDGRVEKVPHQFLQEVGENVEIEVVVDSLIALSAEKLQTKPVVFAEETLNKVNYHLAQIMQQQGPPHEWQQWSRRVDRLLQRAETLKDKVYNIQKDVLELMEDKGFKIPQSERGNNVKEQT